MKKVGHIVNIILDILLFLGALFNAINGSGDWNDYLILFGIILFIPGHVMKVIHEQKES